MTPNILLNKGTRCKIRVSSDRYFPAEIDLRNVPMSNSTLSVFVKRKSGRLSYVQDPHGLRSFFSQVEGVDDAALDFIRSFIEDRKLVAYAKYMCSNNAEMSKTGGGHVVTTLKSTFERFCVNIIQDGLKEEKTESIVTHLTLFDTVFSIKKKAWPSKIMWELRILRSFYKYAQRFELIEPHFVAVLCETVDKFFIKGEGLEGSFGGNGNEFGKRSWTGPFQIWHDVD